jgi:hypothetical protein
MKEVVYLVERGWDYNIVMNMSHHRRKAIIGISLENNPDIKDFDLATYINRDFYLMTEEEKEKYFEKQKIKTIKKEKLEEKFNKIMGKEPEVNINDKIAEIKQKLAKTL